MNNNTAVTRISHVRHSVDPSADKSVGKINAAANKPCQPHEETVLSRSSSSLLSEPPPDPPQSQHITQSANGVPFSGVEKVRGENREEEEELMEERREIVEERMKGRREEEEGLMEERWEEERLMEEIREEGMELVEERREERIKRKLEDEERMEEIKWVNPPQREERPQPLSSTETLLGETIFL